VPLFLGLISGTSMDGIDAALAEVSGAGCRVLRASSTPYDVAVRAELFALINMADRFPLDRVGRLDTTLGRAFAAATLQLLDAAKIAPGSISAVGSHGQTIRHQPEGDTPFTWQIADPNIIAERTGITTVADFRRRDVAAGGEGAPLMPAFHRAVLASDHEPRAVLNLGGIANLTWLGTDGNTFGLDTGPASCLMDGWIERQQGRKFDEDGEWAASGRVNAELLQRLLAEPYFKRKPPKSTGRELFNLAWLDTHLGAFANLAPQDVQATLCELSAATIVAGLHQGGMPARLLVCGGGAHNAHLLRRLAALVPSVPVEPTSAHGIDVDFVEAAGFAWLAYRTLSGLPGNLPSVTGAGHPAVLGAIYPGKGAVRRL
jgi:anhydro-N-acetylmuramic acid kinase